MQNFTAPINRQSQEDVTDQEVHGRQSNKPGSATTFSGVILSGMTIYDDTVLQQYADGLYQEAKWIVFWTAAKYGLLTFVICLAIGITTGLLKPTNPDATAGLVFGAIFVVLGVLYGIDAGRRKAFHLQLEAQQALCQRQIEKNTRAMPQSQKSA
jgi:hypothetical protein